MIRSKALIILIVASITAPHLSIAADGAADADSTTKSAKTPNAVNITMPELLELAVQRQEEVRQRVRDYTCLIVKRERIHGELQSHRYIEAKVRAPQGEGAEKTPLAVQLHFRAPKQFEGRTIVYVEGQHDDQMIVRRGGKRFGSTVVEVGPESELARTETLMHVAHLGFDGMISEIIKHIRSDIAADPTGTNTELKVARHATINDRPCTAVLITHPEAGEGLSFHRAEFFIDDEYHLPVRVAAYDWPTSDSDEPKLLAEFTYTRIKVNVGLTDSDFDAELLRVASKP